ncbi:Uncharacterized protein HZ326_15701 [Fusarium oxysporum f. sp. albedinis]|nr:Uncharacterized protein HZ326_15701 [Fusarium oxysporum f. sp. albedinis]
MCKKRQMEQDEFDKEGGAMSPSVSKYFAGGVMTRNNTMGSLDWKAEKEPTLPQTRTDKKKLSTQWIS